MSEIVTTARTARELLAKGLGGLQANPNVSPQHLQAAEPIAEAMGALHRIERSAGADVVAAAPQALDAIRKALGILQSHATSDAYMISVMETVASSLGHAFALTKMQAPAAQGAPAPAAAATQPVPQTPAAQAWQPPPQQPAPYAPPAQQPAPYAPPAQQPAPYAPPPQPVQPAVASNWQPPAPQAAQPPWQQQPAPQPQPAQPPWQQQPAPPPQPAQPPWQQQPAPQPQPAQPPWQQQPAPQPQPAQPPWQQQPGAPFAPPQAAPQPAPQYTPPPQPAPQAAPYAPPPQPAQGWQQPAPQPQPAQPPWQQQPAPQPQPAQPPWQQQPAPQASPAPYAQQADPFAARAAAPAQPVAPQQAPPGATASPYAVAAQYPLVEAELGTHSPTNFYKGLAGNDVVDHGGIFVATYKIPNVGDTFRVHVSLPGGYEFEAVGVVRWTRESRESMTTDISPPGFGLQFTQITPEARQLVYRYARNREPLFHDDL